MFKITDNGSVKEFFSPDYNYYFERDTGFFARWGRTFQDDPDWSPFGPEILDLEISAGGDCLGNCPFCYKNNGGDQPTHNMTLTEFTSILFKMPRTLTQIAFGIMNVKTNPDFFAMMRLARQNGVVPNYTCHGLDVDDNVARETAEVCGAVAVSIVDREKSYQSVRKFLDAGMKQVNIHYMISEETLPGAFQTIDDAANNPLLKGINAVVFLQHKSKGRNAGSFHPVKDFSQIVQKCREKNVGFGFDSCSAPLFLKAVEREPDVDYLHQLAEPCESALFSSYISSCCFFHPCSFTEGIVEGIDVLRSNDFLQDVWMAKSTQEWRERLLKTSQKCRCVFSKGCRSCPVYDLTACKNF